MVITNSNFSEQAQELAKSNDCILIDRQNLLKKWL
jgi:HJR/Mrr/RecB family endonuclease